MQQHSDVLPRGVGVTLITLGLTLGAGACAGVPDKAMGQARIYGQVWRASTCGRMLTAEEEQQLDCGRKPQQVEIHVASADGRWTKTIISSADGSYSVELPPGDYRLEINAEGILDAARAQAHVSAGESRELWLLRGSRAK